MFNKISEFCIITRVSNRIFSKINFLPEKKHHYWNIHYARQIGHSVVVSAAVHVDEVRLCFRTLAFIPGGI
jgi:hypothetical protein